MTDARPLYSVMPEAARAIVADRADFLHGFVDGTYEAVLAVAEPNDAINACIDGVAESLVAIVELIMRTRGVSAAVAVYAAQHDFDLRMRIKTADMASAAPSVRSN